jgi:outer membrane protein
MMNVNGWRLWAARLGGWRAAACILALALAAPLSASADGERVVALDQAVQQALSGGPDIRASRANLAAAQAVFDAAKAQNAVTLDGAASAARGTTTRYDPSSPTGSASIPEDTGQVSVTLAGPLGSKVGASATQQLLEQSGSQTTTAAVSASATLWDGYLGGAGAAAVKQAGYTLQATQASESASQATAIYGVKQAYYAMLGQQRQTALLSQTLDQRREEQKRTQALFDAGQASIIDQKQAAINLATAELDLRKARGALEVDRETLSALLGWPSDTAYTVAEVPDLPAPATDAAQAVKTALEQRAELRQAALGIASGAVGVDLARAKGSPVVTAATGLNVSQSWAGGQSPSWSWSANAQVSMPILDAGAAAAAVRQARAQVESKTAARDKLAATIAAEVKDALYGLQDLLARADLAQASVDLAGSQYEQARLKFEAGTGSNLDLLTASVALSTARAAEAKARADAQLGALALQSKMGL